MFWGHLLFPSTGWKTWAACSSKCIYEPNYTTSQAKILIIHSFIHSSEFYLKTHVTRISVPDFLFWSHLSIVSYIKGHLMLLLLLSWM